MGFSPTFGARRFPKGEWKELWCARRRKPFFRPGLTRRLRRGRWGCRPEGGSTFFRSERKYQRKPAARHYGKKAFIAHFAGGARYVARSMIGQISPAIRRAPNSPFSAVKMGGPFSLRCLSPPCSPAVGGRQTYLLQVKMVPTAWRSCSAKYEGFCFRRSRRGAGLPLAGVISESHRPAGFGARAMRPVAEWRSALAKRQGAAPDPRAVAPVVPRR